MASIIQQENTKPSISNNELLTINENPIIIAGIKDSALKKLGQGLVKGLEAIRGKAYKQFRRGQITQDVFKSFDDALRGLRVTINREADKGGAVFQRAARIVQRVFLYHNNPNGLVEAMKPSVNVLEDTVKTNIDLKAQKQALVKNLGDDAPEVIQIENAIEANWERFSRIETQIKEEFEAAYTMVKAVNPKSNLPETLGDYLYNIREAAKKISTIETSKNLASVPRTANKAAKLTV